MSRELPTAFVVGGVFLFLTPLLIAQSPVDRTNQPRKAESFESQFWTYLASNNYKQWSPSPGTSGDYFASRRAKQNRAVANPHGKLAKMYLNRVAAGNQFALPVGSVIIMENYRDDKSLLSISVMYKSAGFNPESYDWYWVNYNPDGSVSSSAVDASKQSAAKGENGIEQTFTSAKPVAPKKLMGRASSCIQCHTQSEGRDLVFLNDPDRPSNEGGQFVIDQ